VAVDAGHVRRRKRKGGLGEAVEVARYESVSGEGHDSIAREVQRHHRFFIGTSAEEYVLRRVGIHRGRDAANLFRRIREPRKLGELRRVEGQGRTAEGNRDPAAGQRRELRWPDLALCRALGRREPGTFRLSGGRRFAAEIRIAKTDE